MSSKSESITIYNCSRQMIPIHVRKPKTDFYINEQQLRLNPGTEVTIPASHANMDQILNLKKRGMLRTTQTT